MGHSAPPDNQVAHFGYNDRISHDKKEAIEHPAPGLNIQLRPDNPQPVPGDLLDRTLKKSTGRNGFVDVDIGREAPSAPRPIRSVSA